MTQFKPGNRLDHYLLEEQIASSRTAALFRATDLEAGRQAAIKIPFSNSESDEVFRERFHREADIGRELNHPAIAKVFPEGRQTAGYIAMEWAEGISLRALLEREGKLAPSRAIRIALRVCEALQYIHAQGVVHRDLKPENLMIGPGDSIKLVDFGLAAKAGSRRLTFGKLSAIMGTPDYISPEQVKGKPGDARSDIYALGVILYEMLTGQIPFRGTNPVAIMNDRLLNDPIPLREANAALDRALEAIVQRAIARDPYARYQDAAQLARHLEHPAPAEGPECVPLFKRLMFCSGFAMIPAMIFLLLLYVAHQQ